MSQLSEQYRARAASCDEDAERATLANVRDRSRRSAETWRAMAGQIEAAEARKAEAAKDVAEG
jgi:hypothetical protein